MTTADLADFSASLPWFFPALAFILGAVVGSFLNVVIYRVPAEKSVVRPGSHCACGKPIAWRDNIPILSWLLLRGRARCCGRKFSVRYPFVELLTGLLFLECWSLFPPAKAVCGMVFLSVLICATFIDLDHFIIPDVFTIGAGLAGLLLSALVPALHGQASDLFIVDSVRSGLISLKGLLVGSGLVLWIALIAEALMKKEAMGFGDVKFVGMIGAFCGWHATVFSIFGGAVVGTVWFVIALVWQKIFPSQKAALPAESPDAEGQPAALGFGAHVPFGPMLAIAAALYFLWLHGPVDAYLTQLSDLL
ncbi:MAG TPA: prepilin peptidase [Opitutaceae bacterium]|jgi:leader peptidase (prepilin peptidase)/N-methyltransferase|nr:prepilin peptidase [Opitutaceae bacterium]